MYYKYTEIIDKLKLFPFQKKCLLKFISGIVKIGPLCCCYFIAVFIVSCTVEEQTEPVKGYKPVYLSKDIAREVYTSDPQAILKPGKMYIKEPYVFINEYKKGIHIINNLDPKNPVKLKFIHIPGNVDIAVKGNVLYADNYSDLIALDISDLNNISVKKRVYNSFSLVNEMFPNDYFGYFECVDTTKGFVIDWVETELKDPKCYR